MASKYAFAPKKYAHFFRHPEAYYMKPFRIFGNLWFVGNQNVGAHLLETGKGLILIDTTYPTTRALLVQAIWEAGFDPRNIRYILHTHGHFDHFGATKFLASISGAKTFLGAKDARMFRERPELALVQNGHYTAVPLFKPDVELQDGDIIELGGTRIRAVSTPGHTMGTMAYFVELEEDGKTQVAGLYGGIGLNTLCCDFIEEYRVPEYRKHYIASLEKVRHEPVTITLGNHTSQNQTVEKYKKMAENPDGRNPFIDPAEWERFIVHAEQRYFQMLEEERTGKDQL
ncbi:MBL fold metallo-hydrolase [uncultured Dysosmobacter sp.]|uniref:MBL fold metallo-hydrolase n=1 Tax=uncultured Dysosmobacter sp. TaxID=2591384 RepID=UPI00262ED362|nr:MBL fold metallo-hydrolase [uncultured Dysosmobacter sp.]